MKDNKRTCRQEHDILDAVQDKDGVYRIPDLGLLAEEQDEALQWKFHIGGYYAFQCTMKTNPVFLATGA